MRRKLYKLLFLFMTTIGTLVVTGCGSSLTTYFTSDFPKALEERGQQNKDIAKELLDAGFIDKTMYTNLCNQIDSEVNNIKDKCIIADEKTALNNDAVKALSSAVSAVVPRHPEYVEYEDNNGNSERIYSKKLKGGLSSKVKTSIKKIGNASLSYFVASNYIVGQHLGTDVYHEKEAGKKYRVSTCTTLNGVEPINFFGGQSDIEEALNARFRADMYVLDANAISTSGKSVDEVFAAIKAAVEKDDISGVTHYFKKLEDSNGKAVTLMPEDFNLIGDSKINLDEKNNLNENISQPGYDLVMKQTLLYHRKDIDCKDKTGDKWGECDKSDHAETREVAVMSVRFTEFDKEAFDTLKETISLNSGAYYFENLNSTQSSGGRTTRCYVLTYPISVIDSFELDESTGNVTARFNDDSGMAVSIQSGKLVSYRYNTNGTSFTNICQEVTTSDPYLTMNFDANAGDEKSSLVCDGYRLYTIDFINSKGEPDDKPIIVPRIILRDYLEATWAPGSTEYDETMVVFGRKIRFRTDSMFWIPDGTVEYNKKTYSNNTLCYNTNNKDWCASFINVDGEEVGSLTKLYITDFCDIMSLCVGTEGESDTSNKWEKYIVAHFSEKGVAVSNKECAADRDDLTPTQDKLKATTDVTEIKLTVSFPGLYIGHDDIYNTGAEVQRFYCVATTKGMFNSALYSDWINSTSSKESLTWWNGYLADHGYKYTIGANDVSEYLKNNYSYELSQDGAIILDLDTIHDIQEIFDEEAADDRASLIRTIFVVLGIFLIAYSMALMLCWVIDTNVDLGLSLTNKLTFGHWVAIQYEEELPSYNNEEHSYVDGKHMLIRCLIMVAVAIVIIRVDASELILVLINTFGKIASYVENMIRGTV